MRACGYFTYRFGKIDRLESHSEYWLEQDARLREEFNIQGLRPRDMEIVKRKTHMKQVFSRAGIPVSPGAIASTPAEAKALIGETGLSRCGKTRRGRRRSRNLSNRQC